MKTTTVCCDCGRSDCGVVATEAGARNWYRLTWLGKTFHFRTNRCLHAWAQQLTHQDELALPIKDGDR